MPRLTYEIASLTMLLLACGPESGETESAGSTTETSGTASTTGEPTTTGTPTTTGEPSTGTPQVCEDPSVAEVGPEVKVRLHNAGDGTIWVDRRLFCGAVHPFEVHDAGGEKLNLDLGLCEFTCAEVLVGDCGCPAGCAEFDLVVQIDPGATFEVTWSGAHWPTIPVTEACDRGCEPSCVARERAPPGMYKLVARSSGLLTGCESCGCTANAEGWCEAEGVRGGDEIVAEGMLDYPTQTAITLVFP